MGHDYSVPRRNRNHDRDLKMADKVIVCCKLPNGFLMEVKGTIVKINGTNTLVIKGVQGIPGIGVYAKTTVDAAFYEEWSKVHQKFPPILNKAVWVEKTTSRADGVGKELKDEASGLEGLKQDGSDKRTGSAKGKVKASGDK